MLTKEECKKALDKIQGRCDSLSETFYRFSAWEISESCRIFEKLIYEHFSNPPLKWEELKEGMFVWDNKHYTYILIDRIWETYKKTIYFYAIGWECCENMEFEPNRFYRKEVQE